MLNKFKNSKRDKAESSSAAINDEIKANAEAEINSAHSAKTEAESETSSAAINDEVTAKDIGVEAKNFSPDVNNEITEIQQKCDEYLAGWKRAQADYQNLLKEMEIRRSEYVKYSNANFILEILPIMNNFKTAFSQIPENEKNSAWVVGFGFIKKQLQDFLSQNGVEEIKTVGEKFDHEIHEAVSYETKEGVEEGIIIAEKRAGYKLNGKVLQVAKVVVAGEEEKA